MCGSSSVARRRLVSYKASSAFTHGGDEVVDVDVPLEENVLRKGKLGLGKLCGKVG